MPSIPTLPMMNLSHSSPRPPGANSHGDQHRLTGAGTYLVIQSVVIALLHLGVANNVPLRAQEAAAASKPLEMRGQTASAGLLEMSGRYRLSSGDVMQVTFPYVPEFDQTVTVQPDGYVSLRSVRDVFAQGLTIPEFMAALREAYLPVLREPTVTVALKEFEKPFFIAAGEVARPGKFELRSATTVTQALAIAGGVTKAAKSSQIVLFRRFSEQLLEVKTLNAKKMLARRDLSEDQLLRPGDTVFVPTRALSKLSAFIPQPQLGLYLNALGGLQ